MSVPTNRQEIYEKIVKTVADVLTIDAGAIRPESRFKEDLNADSVDMVTLAFALEEAFGGEISPEDAERLITVDAAVDYTLERMGAKG